MMDSFSKTQSQAQPPKSGPLAGVRVLDLTSVLMGPYCTQILADLGAEVTKVESPAGDTSRYVGPSKTPGRSGMFTNLNRGKRGIVLDLQNPEGVALCLRLAAKADLVLQTFLFTGLGQQKMDEGTGQ